MELLQGQDIIRVHTLKTMYDNSCVEVEFADGQTYRIKTSDLLIALSRCEFIFAQSKVYKYLKVVEVVDESHS